jgi:Ca2+/Na+ antiporter
MTLLLQGAGLLTNSSSTFRLSFVTEQVAAHTNGTIGALLNATFGNAPELLISTAALRSGFYRVVQLAMLGSMLTNLLFVFGVSCLIGGMRWQVQELRITSGNVSVLMLLVATAGSLFPAALSMSGQMQSNDSPKGVPSDDELFFCRINAFVMVVMYMGYLLFQLGTHKEEFDEDENIVETPDNLLIMSPHFTSRHGRKKRAERNRFCLRWFGRGAEQAQVQRQGYATVELMERGGKSRNSDNEFENAVGGPNQVVASDLSESDESEDKGGDGLFRTKTAPKSGDARSLPSTGAASRRRRKRANATKSFDNNELTVTNVMVPAVNPPEPAILDEEEATGGENLVNGASTYTVTTESDEGHPDRKWRHADKFAKMCG